MAGRCIEGDMNDSDGQIGVVRLSNYYSLQASSFREKLKSKKYVQEGFLDPPKGEPSKDWKKVQKST